MAGTRVDEPLDVDFDDIDPDAKPNPKDEPKPDAKSEPKTEPKPASGSGDPKPATPAPDAPSPDAPAAEPKPSVGERIGNGLGFPKEELGKIKSSRGRARRACSRLSSTCCLMGWKPSRRPAPPPRLAGTR